MADSKNSLSGNAGTLQKQKRALLTRQDLLRSARTVFARDGFEHARLEDIAARAGKTRGAFYVNFKDKEDVFFAIFEEDSDRDVAKLILLLRDLANIRERIEALGEYLAQMGQNRERVLLHLEFKLYAIRHPRRRKRLASLHATMRVRCSVPELSQLFVHDDRPMEDTKQKRTQHQAAQAVDALAIGGILDGLALNHFFDPESLSSREIARYLKICLYDMVPEQATRRRSKSALAGGLTLLPKKQGLVKHA